MKRQQPDFQTDRSKRIIKIPDLILKGETDIAPCVALLKNDVQMTQFCRDNLTVENYGPLPTDEKIAWGFYYNSEASSIEDIQLDIIELCRKTGRKFRLGTPFELLWYILLGNVLPEFCISISNIWDNKILFWYPFESGTKFHLYHHIGKWRKDCGIFVVEEL